jgi:hypothetical protein
MALLRRFPVENFLDPLGFRWMHRMRVHYFVLGSDSYWYGLRRLLVDLGLDSNPFQHGFQNVPLNLVRSHFVAVGSNVTAVDYNYRPGLILLRRD